MRSFCPHNLKMYTFFTVNQLFILNPSCIEFSKYIFFYLQKCLFRVTTGVTHSKLQLCNSSSPKGGIFVFFLILKRVSRNILLKFTEERKSYQFQMTWGSVIIYGSRTTTFTFQIIPMRLAITWQVWINPSVNMSEIILRPRINNRWTVRRATYFWTSGSMKHGKAWSIG